MTVSFRDSCCCEDVHIRGHRKVSVLVGMASSGFSESYFGYFFESYLDLVHLEALPSCLDFNNQEALLEILGEEDAQWALVLLVLDRSEIMAGLDTYFEFLDRELAVACLVIEVVVALLV